jgi:hypothetical protein
MLCAYFGCFLLYGYDRLWLCAVCLLPIYYVSTLGLLTVFGLLLCCSVSVQAWKVGGVILNNPYYMWASLVSLFLIGPLYIYIESIESKLEQIPTREWREFYLCAICLNLLLTSCGINEL